MSVFRRVCLRPKNCTFSTCCSLLITAASLLCAAESASAVRFPFRCGGGPWRDVAVCRGHYDFVSFRTPAGSVQFVVPNDRPGGETVSARPFLFPAGDDPATKQKNEDQLRSAYLTLPGIKQPVSLAAKSFVWKAISGGGTICFVPESMLDPFEKSCHDIGIFGKRNDLIGPITSEADEIRAPDFQLIRMPLRVSGNFNGDIEKTFVTLNDNSDVVLAESTAEILVGGPEEVGESVLVVEDAEQRRVRKYIRFYDLRFSPDELPMRKGAYRVELTVSGLSRLEGVKLELAEGTRTLGAGRVTSADGASVKRLEESSPGRGRYQVSDIEIPASAINSSGEYTVNLGVSLWSLGPRSRKTLAVGITSGGFYGTAIEAGISAVLGVESIRQIVSSSIKTWELDNGLAVSEDAATEITKQFEAKENQITLRNLHDRFRIQISDQSTFLDLLVRSYLYSVRDLSLERSRGPLSVVPLAEEFQSSPALVKITLAEVRGIVLSDFLSAWFALNLKTATLEIKSSPDHARPISLDGKPSAKGASTNAECSLPVPGSHTIAVLGDSNWTVHVTLSCPGPHGTIACDELGHSCNVELTGRCEEWVYSVIK